MRRLLLYNIVTLLAVSSVVSEEYNPHDDCPSFCRCEVAGTSATSAECSDFDTKQQFGMEITFLDLSNIPKSKGLKLTDRIFANAGLRRVSFIKIVNSALETIDVNAFHGLHNLNELNLSNNHLGLLEPDMFANNTHLEKLSLSQNPLQYMQVEPSPYNKYFLNIPSLQELDLSNCSISHLLPTMFTKLTTLVYINLASNEIEDISKETFAPLVDLGELDLSNNKLTHIRSDMFEQNTELAVLTLRNNLLSSLSDVSIQSLQTLDLSMCHFTKINADTFAGFPDISNLNLNGNAITAIDSKAFSNMKELHYLDLSNNKLVGQLPDDLLVNNIELETLRLSNNPEMKSIPDTGFQGSFSDLILLDVSGCSLTHLEEDSLKGMSHLARLNLSRNEIQYLKPGVLNTKIIVLDLSRNKIAHLDQIAFPPASSLKQLYLSGNPLKKLSPSFFVHTPRLVKLDLRSCELKQLWEVNDSELQQPMKSLSYLNIENNKIKSLSIIDLYYIDHVQTLAISGNPLICNDELNKVVKYLTENAVASSDSTERKQHEELRKDVSEDAVDIPLGKDKLGWKSFMKVTCESKQRLIAPDSETDNSSENVFNPSVTEPSEDDGDEEVIYMTDPSNDFLPVEEIQREPVVTSKTNYMWPIIIVALSAFAIILALVVLAAFFLRWSRQKNSYRNKIMKRHSIINTPRLRRGGDTMYQQLYEDTNTPTTPVMPSKLSEQHSSEQRTYTFPEKNTSEATSAQTSNNASYLSSPFHHSNIVPESV